MKQKSYVNTPFGPAQLTGETEFKGEKYERKAGILMFPELWACSKITSSPPYFSKKDIHVPPTEISLKIILKGLTERDLCSILRVSQREWTDALDMREKAYLKIKSEIDKCTEEHQRKTQ